MKDWRGARATGKATASIVVDLYELDGEIASKMTAQIAFYGSNRAPKLEPNTWKGQADQ